MRWWEEFRFAFGRWRTNFWFLPALINTVVILLFVLTAWLDNTLEQTPVYLRYVPYWFSGTPGATRDLLSAIATIMGTITTVVFSISILTLQLASSQYTPRLLRSFTRSTVGQATLGILVATIVYSLLTLSIVREETETQMMFVPDISVNVAKLLALTSLGLLVYYIGHIAVLISPSHIIRTAREDTVKAYRHYIKDEIGEDAPPSDHMVGVVTTVTTKKSGYIQRLRLSSLESAAHDLAAAGEGAQIWVIARATLGDYVKKGDTLAEIVVREMAGDDVVDSVRQSFAIGMARLPDSDFRYGIDELYSIALRRISQLDSSTAIECVTALTETWLDMMDQPLYPPNRWIHVKDYRVHLALLPIDTDGQIAESLQRLFENTNGQAKLSDLAIAIIEGLSTIARESAVRGLGSTFDTCRPRLLHSTVELIQMTHDEHILRNIRDAMIPLKDVLCRLCPERWVSFAYEVRQVAESSRKAGPLSDLWR